MGTTGMNAKVSNEISVEKKPKKVAIILGGPGSGKGTQCARISKEFGYTHLSSGEILRKESRSQSDKAEMIGKMLKEGALVPPDVTVPLVVKAMDESKDTKFVFDGFPRDEETRSLFEEITKIDPELVLYFDCPDEVMEKRSLSRKEDRDDDVLETIRGRIKVFHDSTRPVINYYEQKGKLWKVDARKSKEEVYEAVKVFFILQEYDKANCCHIL
ncbi:hypothetical protein K2173_024589 [Erythroxylum novogranatense]|uniref:adenylate kinase n=1 Tax=Erythroxylum novogranatense TaxID=1862640 RepID=A0AAV8SUR1_9ROSI|nr:hypothetical protein K2173_024589 [Erythroxylum novogranatense]